MSGLGFRGQGLGVQILLMLGFRASGLGFGGLGFRDYVEDPGLQIELTWGPRVYEQCLRGAMWIPGDRQQHGN